ncbi:MAG: hypothetical protein JSV88_20875 [Candidatus Aminicenantes bacterium]|nr:MAG: hypothetical protein JSV88_20875 [Candidatus Aminicenantes bacterium]
MAKQELLDELNELLNVPQFERIIFHKVEELKLYFKDEIERYRRLREKFRKSAYGDMQVLEAHKEIGKKIQAYHFELNRTKNDQWLATSIEPSPPPGYEIYDILPEGIVEYIGSFNTAREKIETRKELTLETLKGRAFDLSFTKYSDWHILGLIRSYKIPTGDGTEDEKPDHMTEIYNYNKKETDEGNYKELIYYMQKYPALRRYFFTELHMKMKPLIVGKLVEITASSRPVDLF